MAFKQALTLAVAFANIAAFGASAASISRINLPDPDPCKPCFVFNKLEKPSEAPAVHPLVLNLALFSPTSIPYVLEVFEYQYRPCWDRVHDLACQDVITVAAKPIDLPTQSLQFSLCGLGAFALQDAAVIVFSPFYGFPFLITKELIKLPIGSRHDCWTANTKVDSNYEPVGNKRLAFPFQDDIQEKSVLFVPDEFRSANLPFGITVEVGWQDKIYCLASVDRCQGSPSLLELNHRSPLTVIAYGLPERLRTLKCFGFPFLRILFDESVSFFLEGMDGSKCLRGFRDHSTDELRRQFGLFSLLVVSHAVDSTAVSNFSSKPLLGSSIERCCKLDDSLLEYLGRVKGTYEFQFERYIHAHILYENTVCSFNKMDVISTFLGRRFCANSSPD